MTNLIFTKLKSLTPNFGSIEFNVSVSKALQSSSCENIHQISATSKIHRLIGHRISWNGKLVASGKE